MDRRQFLKWSLATVGAFGIGRIIGNFYKQPSIVTLLDVPDTNRDFHREIARVMADDGLVLRDKKVLLKPNFVEWHPGRPINTDIEVIRQVAEACLLLGAREVIVGEAAGHRRDPWFSVNNPAVRQALDKKIRRVDLNHGNVTRILNKGFYTGLPCFYLAEDLTSADVVISLPKLKTHHWVGATLSMKNLFGTLPGIYYGWPKNVLHCRGIVGSIVDLALSIPVHYAIIDGIIGMEGDGPILGTPKKVGTILMGKDLLAVDSTAARIMGFDAFQLSYMALAALHLPGLDSSIISYRGEHPRKYATRFDCLAPFKPFQKNIVW